MEILTWLSGWFKQNCDGDWEHNYTINISSLDNPGWSFTADLSDTEWEGKLYSSINFINDDDWFDIKSDGNTFNAFGDVSKLLFLIEHFRVFVESKE